MSLVNSNNRKINPGVFTCQTCNALFTCLVYYQQHRKNHAESSSIKLLCCNHCPYSTENQFHYNWHVMSHEGEEAHTCSVCKVEEEPALASSSNHLDSLDGDDEECDGLLDIGKRSVAIGTNDDLLAAGHRISLVKDESPDDTTLTFLTSSYSPPSDQELHELGADFGHHGLEDDANGAMNGNMGHSIQNDDITDEEDDEEEEIESEEEDDGLDDYSGGLKVLEQHEENQQENQDQMINFQQGPPYTKSPNAIPGSDPVPATGRGRGKGNRKSRIISSGNESEDGSELRRKFHCSHCGKSFKTKSHLQRHILTHTGEKPYHCNRCGSKFNQSSSLRNHIIAIHTKEYPHFCPHCNKGFLMPALLTKHLSTNHRTAK